MRAMGGERRAEEPGIMPERGANATLRAAEAPCLSEDREMGSPSRVPSAHAEKGILQPTSEIQVCADRFLSKSRKCIAKYHERIYDATNHVDYARHDSAI
jgi:hypothetical protein